MNRYRKFFAECRKLSRDKLQVLESNTWFMVRFYENCKGATPAMRESYLAKNRIVKAVLARFAELNRPISEAARRMKSLSECVTDYRRAVKEGDKSEARNCRILLSLYNLFGYDRILKHRFAVR